MASTRRTRTKTDGSRCVTWLTSAALLAGTVVLPPFAPQALADAPVGSGFTAELVAAQGFSDGVATEIGLLPRDLAWDVAGDRLLVADCEVLRAVDPVANSSTVIAIAADLPNPTNVATFVGRVQEVAVRTDGTVLLGLNDDSFCSDLYWDRVARMVVNGAAVPLAGNGSTAADVGVSATDADWQGLQDLAVTDVGSIFVIPSAGVVHAFVEGGQLSLGDVGVAVSPAGEVFRIVGAELSIVDSNGVERLVPLQAPLPSLPSFPRATTFGDDALWIVGGTRVVRVDTVTGAVDEIGDIASIGGRDASYWTTIAASPDGVAYTTSDDTGVFRSGRVMAVSPGSSVTVVAGTVDRWQGEGRAIGRQQLGVNEQNPTVFHGRPSIAADSSGVLHVFGSRLASADTATGLTSTDPYPDAFWIGQRPNGDEVLTVPTVPGDVSSPRRLVVRSAATGVVTPLLPDPLDQGSEPFIDVAPDGTVYVVALYGSLTLTAIAVDGTVTTEPVGDRPIDQFGNPTDAFTVWATASGLFAYVSTGLIRRVGSTWIDAGTCAGADGPFSPLVALRSGRFLGTVAVGAAFKWCRVDPSTGTGTLFADDVTFPIPESAREADDGFVYFGSNAAGTDGIYRMQVSVPVPPTTTVTVAMVTAGAPAQEFVVSGVLTGVIAEATGALTADVTPGPQQLRVTAPSGFGLDGIVCSDPDASVNVATGTISLSASEGEQITCTVAASGRGTTLPPAIASTSFGSFGLTWVILDAPSECGPATSMTFNQNNHIRYSSGGVSTANVSWTIPLPANPSPTFSQLPTPVVIPAGSVPPISVVRSLSAGTVSAVFTQSGPGAYSCWDMTDVDTSGEPHVLGHLGGTDTDGWWRRVTVPMMVDLTITPDVGLPRRYQGPASYYFQQAGFLNDAYRPGGAGYTGPGRYPFVFGHSLGFDSALLTGETLAGPLGTGGYSAADVLSPGGTLTSPAPTADDPVSVSVTVPTGGSTAISIAPGSSLTGTTNSYQLGGRLVRVVAPDGTAAQPLEMRFRVNSTEGPTRGFTVPTRNGVPLADCAPAAASWPVPCVVAVIDHPDGDREWVVKTPAASEWGLVTQEPYLDEPAPPSNVVATRSGSSVTVTWDASSTPDAGYWVQVVGTTAARVVAPGGARSVTLVSPTGTEVTVETLLDDGSTSREPAMAVITGAVDTTPPTITCPAGVSFTFKASGRTLTASVSDEGSGAESPTVSVAANTTTAGARTVSVTASDLAGNATTVSCPYRVVYKVDWLLPLGGPDQVRSVLRNTVVPFTFRLTDASGAAVPGAIVSAPTSVGVACPNGPKPLVVSLPGNASTTRLSSGWWLAGWKANSSWRNTCRRVSIDLADGTTLSTTFLVL